MKRRLKSAFRLEPFDGSALSLFEFRRFWIVSPSVQVVVVVALFVLTVILTNVEYKQKGTCFGFPGPAFNMLFNPIYEELIFRGLILGAIARHRSNVFAIIVSSLLFGIFHIRNIYWLDIASLTRMMAFTGLLLGPLFAYVTLRCRSVWPAVILHYMNNLAYYLRH